MNILFISIAWPSAGNRNLYTDLMQEFVKKGHRVYVAATHDTKPGTLGPEVEEGITVVRVNPGKIRKASYFR